MEVTRLQDTNLKYKAAACAQLCPQGKFHVDQPCLCSLLKGSNHSEGTVTINVSVTCTFDMSSD